ncbi:MAG TPA: hypothetical protein V6D05_06965 [Stenomitos sp.]
MAIGNEITWSFGRDLGIRTANTATREVSSLTSKAADKAATQASKAVSRAAADSVQISPEVLQALSKAQAAAAPQGDVALTPEIGQLIGALIPGLGGNAAAIQGVLDLLKQVTPEVRQAAKETVQLVRKAERIPNKMPVRDGLEMVKDLAEKNLKFFKDFSKTRTNHLPAMRNNLETILRITDMAPDNQFNQLINDLTKSTLAKADENAAKGLAKTQHETLQMGSEHILMVSNQGLEGMKRFMMEG